MSAKLFWEIREFSQFRASLYTDTVYNKGMKNEATTHTNEGNETMKTTRRTLSRERINSLGRLELVAILADRTNANIDDSTMSVEYLRDWTIELCHG